MFERFSFGSEVRWFLIDAFEGLITPAVASFLIENFGLSEEVVILLAPWPGGVVVGASLACLFACSGYDFSLTTTDDEGNDALSKSKAVSGLLTAGYVSSITNAFIDVTDKNGVKGAVAGAVGAGAALATRLLVVPGIFSFFESVSDRCTKTPDIEMNKVVTQTHTTNVPRSQI
jgi:hypothetical protein